LCKQRGPSGNCRREGDFVREVFAAFGTDLDREETVGEAAGELGAAEGTEFGPGWTGGFMDGFCVGRFHRYWGWRFDGGI
jgi:hypothetical protein